jgi:predicted phage tail protein
MTHPIKGAKGSGAQHTPVESPDNLRSIAYFRILDLVSEGEIAGLVNG